MSYQKKSNSQIIKNSFLLYIRTLFTIVLSIYISRVVLLALGTDDFGIFSVVGGIAVIFTFLGSSFFNATQRFLAMALVKGDLLEYKKTFTTSFFCYLAISFVILLLGETIGLYIVNHVLNIEPSRILAANYVYQFALCSVVLGLTNSPYKASIIVYEKYTYYAYADVIIKLLRLCIVYAIVITPGDKLIVYSALYMLVSFASLIMDKVYCHIHFKGCRIIKYWNRQIFMTITKFSFISLFKKSAETSTTQGNNIMVNMFGGLTASASYGLSSQVWGTLTGFFLNVQVAYNSQILKSYGDSDYKRFKSLVLDSSSFSSYVVILLAIPLIINMPLVLKIWLKDVPMYAEPFCSAVIFSCFIASIVNPLETAIIAVGKIKRYQTIVSIMYFTTIPITLVALNFGMVLVGVFVIKIICQILESVYSIKYLSSLIDFDSKRFITNSLISTAALLFGIFIPINLKQYIIMEDIPLAILLSFIGEFIFILFLWTLGLSKEQKNKILSSIRKKRIGVR